MVSSNCLPKHLPNFVLKANIKMHSSLHLRQLSNRVDTSCQGHQGRPNRSVSSTKLSTAHSGCGMLHSNGILVLVRMSTDVLCVGFQTSTEKIQQKALACFGFLLKER